LKSKRFFVHVYCHINFSFMFILNFCKVALPPAAAG